MPTIYEVTNHMNPMRGLMETSVEDGFCTSQYNTRSDLQYIKYINNRRVDGPFSLHSNDVVILVPCVHGSIGIGIVVSLIVAAAVYFFVAPAIPTNEGLPESDPVYSFKGQNNQIKPGEVIERHYGEVRHWPTFAARPYNQFIGDQQWLYALFCIGIGDYEVDEVLVDDTPIENFENASYQVYKPGEQVTLFPTNVHTSSEIGGIEMIGPNEDGYDWLGPYIIVPAQRNAYIIELDIVFRNGLYSTSSKGKLRSNTATATFEARKIKDDGTPDGDWFLLLNFSKTLSTTNTARFTVSASVPLGRYEIRGQRTNDVSSDFKARSTMTWEAARSFIKTRQNFGDVTLLAIKVQASNNLNENSRNKFNVRLRSKAWTYDSETSEWSIQETRNPVWAACDIILSRAGGNIPREFIDVETISEIAAELEDEEIYFDGTFDSRGTAWQSITECLMSSRCRPNLPGTQFSIVRDSVMTIPTLCLNGHNIVKDSVNVSYEFKKGNDKDGLEVEYVDPVTWERKQVMCLISPDQGINPERVRLPGCKSRDLAYQWGMHHRATKTYLKINVSLVTGVEGDTVSLGDLVAVQHDLLPNDEVIVPEHTGRISENIYHSGSNTIITLPFRPTFEDGETHRIGLRRRNGELAGPYVCTQGDGNTVVVGLLLSTEDINVSGTEELPIYFFGITGKETSLFKIIDIKPAQDKTIRLDLAPYDERIYAYINATAPAESNDFSYPVFSNSPVVEEVSVEQLPQTLEEVVIRWSIAIGASSYIVEFKYEGDSEYQRLATVTTSSINMPVEPGNLYVRVAAVGQNTGPWAYWDGEVGVAENPPYGAEEPYLAEDFDGTTLSVECDEIPLAESYKWNVYIGTDLIATYSTDTNSFNYTSTQAKADATAASLPQSRTFNITVTGSNSIGDGEESDPLEVTNEPPVATTGLSSSVIQDLGGAKRCMFFWDPVGDLDLELYQVHGSTSSGFTPSPSTLLVATTNLSAEAILTTGVPFYWVVGVKDRWGVELSFTGEETITP